MDHSREHQEAGQTCARPAFAIAKADGTEITTLIRTALKEYVGIRQEGSQEARSKKMDDYLESSPFELVIHPKPLTREDLRQWADSDVLTAARHVRARKQELDFELRGRGYYFRW